MVKTVKVRAPGTCGEWIQTYDHASQKECLVSLPINRYNEMTFSFEKPKTQRVKRGGLLPKSEQALLRIGDFIGLSPKEMDMIQIQSQCRSLAIGKGMASSTADLMSIFMGVSALFDKELRSDELLALCCEIEPTDGTMFSGWSLIDHLEGRVMEHFPKILPCEILLLSPGADFDTLSLRKAPEYQQLLKNKSPLPLQWFREGMAESSLEKLGNAATQSLLENESILKKKHFHELLELCEKFHCHGLAGGHSGTVTGLILNEKNTDLPRLLNEIKVKNIGEYYQEVEVVKVIGGGCEITILEG